jgi:hypothetical protein
MKVRYTLEAIGHIEAIYMHKLKLETPRRRDASSSAFAPRLSNWASALTSGISVW